jgi:hypothetical protein
MPLPFCIELQSYDQAHRHPSVIRVMVGNSSNCPKPCPQDNYRADNPVANQKYASRNKKPGSGKARAEKVCSSADARQSTLLESFRRADEHEHRKAGKQVATSSYPREKAFRYGFICDRTQRRTVKCPNCTFLPYLPEMYSFANVAKWRL